MSVFAKCHNLLGSLARNGPQGMEIVHRNCGLKLYKVTMSSDVL